MRVTVENLRETMALLKGYEPEQSKLINKRITDAANVIRDDARSLMPSGNALSNWGSWAGRLDYSGSPQRSSVKTTRAAMRRRGQFVTNFIGVVTKSASAVVWHTAGRRNSSQFSSAIEGHYGGSRGIWAAFDANEGKAAAEIEAATDDAQRLVQARLNALGGI
jgi:hypothetical protein